MMNLHTVQTPEAAVTISWDLYPVGKLHVETEGSATIIRIGRIEILVDPNHRETKAIED